MQDLAAAGLPVPDTHTYADASLTDVLDAGVPEPCVVKSVRGNRGEGVFLAPSSAMLHDVHGSLRKTVPFLFQDYVEHSRGRDLRVVVVDDRPVTAVIRTARRRTFKSNVHQGGVVTDCTGRYPHGEALAVRAAQAVGLTVAGVDLLFASDEAFTVCEVNANVGWRAHMKDISPAIVAACETRLGTLR